MRTSKVKTDKDTSKDVSKDVSIKEEKMQRQRPSGMIDGFLGKDISITFRGGSKLEGKLESVAQYEMIITISQSPVIVMKHAIDYVELVSKK